MNPCLSLCLEGEWARDWKVRSTKVDAGDFKHELLNRLRSTMAVNVLKYAAPYVFQFYA